MIVLRTDPARPRVRRLPRYRTSSCAAVLGALLCACGGTGKDEVACEDAGPQAATVLETYCYKCHGQNGTAEGSMNFILDGQQLVERGKVVPGDPNASRIYIRMSDGSMPPPTETARPSAEDIAAIERWIECETPAFADSEPPRPFISNDELIHAIRLDLEQLAAADRQFTRYLSLVNLHNNPDTSTSGLDTYRHGVSKMVNSLSQGAVIVVPVAIDANRLIYRIDMRDYRWEVETGGADRWEHMLGFYPYGLVIPDNADAAFIYAATGTQMPYINADWFVFKSSEPPLYDTMLRLPSTVAELQQFLGVDPSGPSVSAGFVDSGVSTSNRIITRRSSDYGAFWESADFASSVADKNILERPLPPASGFPEFEHARDGGEYIFSLPNGLHAFMISDAAGNTIPEAPTSIVFDRNDSFDPAVRSGRKCAKCHTQGIIDATDDIRDHVEASAAFPDPVKAQVLARYPDASNFEAVLEQDRANYLAALAKTGVPAKVDGEPASQPIPLTFLANDFQDSVDLARAAADLGLTPAALQSALSSSDALDRNLGSLLIDGALLKRETFTDVFPFAACVLGLGEPFVNGELLPCEIIAPPAEPACGCHNPDNDDSSLPDCELSCAGNSIQWFDACGVLNYVSECEAGETCKYLFDTGEAYCGPL